MKINCSHAEVLPLHKIIPNPKNPNKHPPEQIERLAKLIDYQGQRHPIIVSRRSGFVVVGHGRLEAIRKLGWESAAVDFQDFADEAQEYAFVTSDNAIAEWAELDLAAINTEMLDLGPDFDIDLLGIKDFVIEPVEKFEPQSDEDEVPEVVHPITRKGDLWLLGRHRLLCGDSTMIDDVERLMGGEKADFLHTDPPYNIAVSRGESIKNDDLSRNEFQALVDGFASNAFAVCKPNAAWLVWIGWREFGRMKETIENHKKVDSCIVWKKESFGLGHAFRYQHELAVFSGKISARDESEVWEFKKDRSGLHPTMKPVELCEKAINLCSNSGDAVLDMFAGSGGTLIACEKNNRRLYGMELDEKYCDVIVKRWEKYTGKQATLELTGQTYEELKAERDGTAA
jgi:DNA modification methylase